MPRDYIPITRQMFDEMMVSDFPYGFDGGNGGKIEKDLDKVFADWDFQFQKAGQIGNLHFNEYIMGGDWETPVFFIVYWDGKEFRAYIPKDGNAWNTDNHKAYGNHEASDKKNALKRFGTEDYKSVNFDYKKMYADIGKRIVEKGGSLITDDDVAKATANAPAPKRNIRLKMLESTSLS